MTTEITLDHIGGRAPAVAATLDASHVDAAGASRAGTKVHVPLVRVDAAQSAVTATIASGASLSAAVDLGAGRAVRIVAPTAWTAAVLTFQTSWDGTTFSDLYDEVGVEVSYTPVAGKAMRLPFADWLGIRHVKIRSGTSAAPVAQAADRTLTIVTQG